jgi:hypothetical protein
MISTGNTGRSRALVSYAQQMPIKGDTLYPFKWFFRPELVPIVRIAAPGEEEEYGFDALHSILSEIDSRHWNGIKALLIEAKQRAEQQLRNDLVIKDSRLSAYYQGWVNYSDYVLVNFEAIRAGEQFGGQVTPGDTTSEVR